MYLLCVCQELERVKATSRKASRVQRDILMAKRFEEEQQRHREVNNAHKLFSFEHLKIICFKSTVYATNNINIK